MPVNTTPTPALKGSIAKMQAAVRALAKLDIGYDQWNRWRFFKNGKLVKGATSADCSSMCGAIGELGGYLKIDVNRTWYTGNFALRMRVDAGFEVFYFTSVSQVRPGDFIVAPGKHVEFCYGKRVGLDGYWWYSARNDENGRLGGGRPGNQGGRENVGWGRPYDMTRGGSRVAYIVRPPDSQAPMTALPKGPKGTLVKGAKGTRVLAVQKRLNAMGWNLDEDGEYGPDTVRAVVQFQRARGFAKKDQDGQWGVQTGNESLKARAEKWTKQ